MFGCHADGVRDGESRYADPPVPTQDRETVLGLARRLTIGVAPWRDHDAVQRAARGWLRDSIQAIDNDAAVFVAQDDQGQVCGVVTVASRTHFTGSADAYVGELVVSETHERRGIGRALMCTAEQWGASTRLRRPDPTDWSGEPRRPKILRAAGLRRGGDTAHPRTR